MAQLKHLQEAHQFCSGQVLNQKIQAPTLWPGVVQCLESTSPNLANRKIRLFLKDDLVLKHYALANVLDRLTGNENKQIVFVYLMCLRRSLLFKGRKPEVSIRGQLAIKAPNRGPFYYRSKDDEHAGLLPNTAYWTVSKSKSSSSVVELFILKVENQRKQIQSKPKLARLKTRNRAAHELYSNRF
ncbi:hypothetical protein C0J52_02127 [Blattella germanica]|nr:hypothetical protein C0J52_02127 [Blattella germanica]